MLNSKYFRFLCIISITLTFVLQNSYSQEQKNYQKEKITEINKIDVSESFFLLENYTNFDPSYQIIKKINPVSAIVKFHGNINKEVLDSRNIYRTSDEWKLADSFRINDSIYNIQVLDNFIPNYPIQVIEQFKNYLKVQIEAQHFNILLRHPKIIFISTSDTPSIESSIVGHDLSINNINFAHDNYPEIDGEDFNVSIKEYLFDIEDIDLKNRAFTTSISSERIDQHATSMATLIIGAENSAKEGGGIARKANAYSSNFLNLLPDQEIYFRNNNISIQNHSYGTSISSEYGLEAAAYDEISNLIPELIHVFSSGNSGLENGAGIYTTIEGYGTFTGNFKVAKNVLTVAAINEQEQIVERSSKGPAYDGRLKPELAAYATQGTSDAAALVSGSILLIQNLFKDSYGTLPPSQLIRAVLIAAADDVGRENIDFETGYGNLDLENSLDIIAKAKFISSEITDNAQKEFELIIPENTAEIRLALSWIDPAANAGDFRALQNDLDLQLISGAGEKYLPWVLNAESSLESLESLPDRREDHLNNNEFISIENPKAGIYTIQINSSELVSETQKFAIAYQSRTRNDFEWTFPNSKAGLIQHKEMTVRWKNTFDSVETAMLEININDTGWRLISEEIDLSQNFSKIRIDENGLCKLRMTVENQVFVSRDFTIAPKLSPEVNFNCEDNLKLSWSSVPNASSYKVYKLGEKFLEKFIETESTSIEIEKNRLETSVFSVVPTFKGIEGEKGLAIDYTLQGVGCYFNNFFAVIDKDLQISSTLNLSTLNDIKRVDFFKEVDGRKILIETINAPFLNNQLNSLDDRLKNGSNFYFAEITLYDDSVITTNMVEFFVPAEDTFSIYPNPLDQGESLQLISKGDDLDFFMYDLQGKLIAQDQLIQFTDRLEFRNLPRGIYILVAKRNDLTVGSKKLIIK